MTRKLKITPGKWVLGDENNACCSVLLGDKHNLTAGMCRQDNNTGETVIERSEMLANAELIAEAGTVANECGLMPRELLAHRDDLLAALRELELFVRVIGLDSKPAEKAAKSARAAIARVRGEP